MPNSNMVSFYSQHLWWQETHALPTISFSCFCQLLHLGHNTWQVAIRICLMKNDLKNNSSLTHVRCLASSFQFPYVERKLFYRKFELSYMDFWSLCPSSCISQCNKEEWRLSDKLKFCYVQWGGTSNDWKNTRIVALSFWHFYWQHWWTHQWQVHWLGLTVSVTLPQESNTLLQAFLGETVFEWSCHICSSRTTRHIWTQTRRACGRRQLNDQEASYIHLKWPLSKWHILLPASSNPSVMCAVKRCDIQHGLVKARTHLKGHTFCA